MQLRLGSQLRLVVQPVVAGAGRRLFEQISEKKRLRLVQAATIGDNLASLTYDAGRAAY